MYLGIGAKIRLQSSEANPSNRPQPKVIITIVIIKLKLWPAAGCEAKVGAESSFRHYDNFNCIDAHGKRV